MPPDGLIEEVSITSTFWAKVFIAGPIEVAKQYLREECMSDGLCVTIEPTLYIYTGGEEAGYVVGLIQYPRFPTGESRIRQRAEKIGKELMVLTCQKSFTIMDSNVTTFYSRKLK